MKVNKLLLFILLTTFLLFYPSSFVLADVHSFIQGTYFSESDEKVRSEYTPPEDLEPGMICITSFRIIDVVEEKKPIRDSIVRVRITSADCKEVSGAATPWACSPSQCRGSVGDTTEMTLWEADPIGWILD